MFFYLACGVAAAVVHILVNANSPVPTVGASGAIAGVMGAYLIKFPRAHIVTLVFIFIFLTTLDIPAAFLLLYWFAIQFFSGVGSVGYSQASSGDVAWFAHVGGFLAGMGLILLMSPRQPRYQHGPEMFQQVEPRFGRPSRSRSTFWPSPRIPTMWSRPAAAR